MECLTCIPFTIKFDLRLVVVRPAVKFVASTTSPMKKGWAISTLYEPQGSPILSGDRIVSEGYIESGSLEQSDVSSGVAQRPQFFFICLYELSSIQLRWNRLLFRLVEDL